MIYLVSLGAGLLVGVLYSLLNVRSPAPPVVALVGLLGILLGEQIIPVGRDMIAGTSLSAAWQQLRCTQHLFGALPGRHAESPQTTRDSEARKEPRP
jgi:XapX domain-containing protein